MGSVKGYSVRLRSIRARDAVYRAPAFQGTTYTSHRDHALRPCRQRPCGHLDVDYHPQSLQHIPLVPETAYGAIMVLSVKFMPSKAPRSQTVTPPVTSPNEPEAHLVVPAKLYDTFDTIRKRAIGRLERQGTEYVCSDEAFGGLCTEKGASIDSSDTLADYYSAKNLQDDVTLLIYRITPSTTTQGRLQTSTFSPVDGPATPPLTRKRKRDDEAVEVEAGSDIPVSTATNNSEQDASGPPTISSESDDEWPVARGDWTMKERRNLLAGVQQGLTIELALKRYKIRRKPASARAQIKMLGQSKVVSREVMARRPSVKKRPRYSSCSCGRSSQSEHRAKSPVVLIRAPPRRSSTSQSTTAPATQKPDGPWSDTIDGDYGEDPNTEALIAAQLGVDITQSVGEDGDDKNDGCDKGDEHESHEDGQDDEHDSDDDEVWATPGVDRIQHQPIQPLPLPLEPQQWDDMSDVPDELAVREMIPASTHRGNAPQNLRPDLVDLQFEHFEDSNADDAQLATVIPASPPAGRLKRPLRFRKLEQARNERLERAQATQAQVFTASIIRPVQRLTSVPRIRPSTPTSSTAISTATHSNIQRVIPPEKLPAHLEDADLWAYAQKEVLHPSDAEWYYVYLKWVRTAFRAGPEVDRVALNDDYTRKRHAFERARGLRGPKQLKRPKSGLLQCYGLRLSMDVDDADRYESDVSELTDLDDRIHFPVELLNGGQGNSNASGSDSDYGYE